MTRRWSEAQGHYDRSDCSPTAGLEGADHRRHGEPGPAFEAASPSSSFLPAGPSVSARSGPTTATLSGLPSAGHRRGTVRSTFVTSDSEAASGMERVRPTRLDRCQYARHDRELRSTTVCPSAPSTFGVTGSHVLRPKRRSRRVKQVLRGQTERTTRGSTISGATLRAAVNREGLIGADGSVAGSTQRVKVGRDDETPRCGPVLTSSARCREGTTDGRSRRQPR